MKWSFQSKGNLSSEFQMISDEGHTINFKYSRTQYSIRMRFEDHHGVYVLDEGGLASRKFSIRNVYGSEIGIVTKGAWRETTGSIHLDDLAENISYELNDKDATLEIIGRKKTTITLSGELAGENYLLAAIVFAWMESVTENKMAKVG